jgi:hypothetical protein
MEAPGMTYKTLRDEIAIAALVVFMRVPSLTPEQISANAYIMADAMLEARESSSPASPTTTIKS